MPMIGNHKSNLYPLPDGEILKKFFHASMDATLRMATVVMLKPPGVARVKYISNQDQYEHKEAKTFNIAIPWHTFGAALRFRAGICMGAAFIHFFNRKPESTQETACWPPFPNLYAHGRICYGRTRPWRGSRIDRYMEDLYRNYWMGNFTDGIGIYRERIPGKIMRSVGEIYTTEKVLAALEKASEEGVKIAWKGHGAEEDESLHTLLSHMPHY